MSWPTLSGVLPLIMSDLVHVIGFEIFIYSWGVSVGWRLPSSHPSDYLCAQPYAGNRTVATFGAAHLAFFLPKKFQKYVHTNPINIYSLPYTLPSALDKAGRVEWIEKCESPTCPPAAARFLSCGPALPCPFPLPMRRPGGRDNNVGMDGRLRAEAAQCTPNGSRSP
jgi:hypothetical protein